MNKRGSILIELIISINIVLIAGIIMLSFVSSLLSSYNNREIVEMMNRDIYSISCEIKYNNDFDKLNERIAKEEYYIKYDKNFISRLSEDDIFSLERGKNNIGYVKLKIINNQDNIIKLNIQIKFKDKVIEEEIEKARWMDEI